MSVYLDVGLRADERAAVAASRRLIDLFAHTGSQINRDLSSQLGKALATIDGSAARRELWRCSRSSAAPRMWRLTLRPA